MLTNNQTAHPPSTGGSYCSNSHAGQGSEFSRDDSTKCISMASSTGGCSIDTSERNELGAKEAVELGMLLCVVAPKWPLKEIHDARDRCWLPMPHPQRVQPRQRSSSDIENEAGSSGSDVERTPRPLQKRKRSSNVFMNGNGDSSFSDERVPLKMVQLNDDDAERRRRRKSVKLAAPMMDVDDMASTPKTRPGAQVHAVEQTPAIRIPLDVMNTNFEEWMKMATDNVISL
jgi:Condensin complex subunit 2